jgi:hypothetical protein
MLKFPLILSLKLDDNNFLIKLLDFNIFGCFPIDICYYDDNVSIYRLFNNYIYNNYL